MAIQSDNTTPHTLHFFDSELEQLNALLLEMADGVVLQLNQTLRALAQKDVEGAEKVISADADINRYELQIDAHVLTILAQQCPVASDLRTVISTSRIADELERTGDEIVEFAKLVVILYSPKNGTPNPKLLKHIVNLGGLVKDMLDKLQQLLHDRQLAQAYELIRYDSYYEAELEEGIKHQLSYIMNDARLIRHSLDIMQIMKSLGRCGGYCRHIAEYMVFMIEGVDIRHCPIIELPKATL